MTVEEKNAIFNEFNEVTIPSLKPMTLAEMKAYVMGFEDARNEFFNIVDAFYQSNKTD